MRVGIAAAWITGTLGILAAVIIKGCQPGQNISVTNPQNATFMQARRDMTYNNYASIDIARYVNLAYWEGTKNCGNRIVYNDIVSKADQEIDPKKKKEILKYIKTIKDDYKTSILVPRIDAQSAICKLGTMHGDRCELEPVVGFNAKNVVDHLDNSKYPRCVEKARAACILRNISTALYKEKIDMVEVVERLIFIMREDNSLLVSKLALDRYSQFTGFKPPDIFDFESAIDNWKDRIAQKQPLLLPEYCFKSGICRKQ